MFAAVLLLYCISNFFFGALGLGVEVEGEREDGLLMVMSMQSLATEGKAKEGIEDDDDWFLAPTPTLPRLGFYVARANDMTLVTE